MVSIVKKEQSVDGWSQADRAFSMIRLQILSGQLAPGAKLKIQDLAESLEVSPGAVREALSRLVPEHLVVAKAQRGFSVALISISDLQDLTELRCVIEESALRRSIAKGDSAWDSRLLDLREKISSSSALASGNEARITEEWEELHPRLHRELVGTCASPRLLSLHEQLYLQAERYIARVVFVDVNRDILKEHVQLLDLALERRVEGLVEAMNFHIRRTADAVIEYARDNPDFAP